MPLPMPPADSVFLLGESREHPMHVGGLVLLQPPDGAESHDVRAMLDAAVARNEVTPLLSQRARRSVSSLGQWSWETDTQFDIGHHIRHDALARPGGMRELSALLARLHGTLLDRNRPRWEMHLIEGLADGHYAVYTKIHHSVTDGVGAMRLLRRSLSIDADKRGMPAPWEPRIRSERPTRDTGLVDVPLAAVRAAVDVIGEATGLVPALTGTVLRALQRQGGPVSFAAPHSALNVPITGARQFAARSWPLDRLRLVAKYADATINDVVLAMCSGALRSHLTERGMLPVASLVAMVPVSLRDSRERPESIVDPNDKSGNEIGTLMCNLGTDLADAGDRLARVHRSMMEGKASLRGMSTAQIVAMSALGSAPLALDMLLGHHGPVRPPYNIVISNVPGPNAPLYWNGALLDALYPLSIPLDGQALNITCTSTEESITFGLTGCRRAVPRLEPILEHLDHELAALEIAVGI
ncbi:WS/DGAT/MGAT family O-acyltransferase [Rhodococcus sp. W8901]|uniref:WS/DGAT/MGAT family O-acyltransferase n=1 Tax=Rhodococcus sp. W8901 TaxID=2742603 RepID=UPI0015835BF5|nr:wax ester/triacylglycerol synthase family O-acyltransferase [Rhodococcus sp. W8901]QKT13264.1 wax ester/triacylglycerol synthase family O-acyltransferase [Rhodococcus sp. W8901]